MRHSPCVCLEMLNGRDGWQRVREGHGCQTAAGSVHASSGSAQLAPALECAPKSRKDELFTMLPRESRKGFKHSSNNHHHGAPVKVHVTVPGGVLRALRDRRLVDGWGDDAPLLAAGALHPLLLLHRGRRGRRRGLHTGVKVRVRVWRRGLPRRLRRAGSWWCSHQSVILWIEDHI